MLQHLTGLETTGLKQPTSLK